MLPSFVIPRDFVPNNFETATQVKPLESNVYTADIKRDWTAILVPNGGYLMSIVATAVQTHFETKRPDLQQKDPIAFHAEFLATAKIGYAEIHVTELKIGRQFSVIRAQLIQFASRRSSKGGQDHDDKSQARICMEALVTQGNLDKEAQRGGISLPTRKIDIPKRDTFLEPEYDPDWPFIRPAAFKIQHTLPPGSTEELAHPKFGPSVREEWVRWAPGTFPAQGFTPLALPYLADSFRPLPEAYGLEGYWYPTLNYGLEIKKGPATSEGWEWLLLRIEVHAIKNGRYDMNIMIFEESGDLVAVGNHVALLLNPADNKKAKKSKI